MSVSQLVLVAVNGHGVGTLTLTAQGGPVSYSISAAANLAISPASGSLASGASATILADRSGIVTVKVIVRNGPWFLPRARCSAPR